MPKSRKRSRSPEYLVALKLILEQGSYVLQKRAKKTGQWKTDGDVINGKEAAYVTLNKVKEGDRYGYEWRVIQDVVAQAYQDNWRDREEFATGEYVPYDESVREVG